MARPLCADPCILYDRSDPGYLINLPVHLALSVRIFIAWVALYEINRHANRSYNAT